MVAAGAMLAQPVPYAASSTAFARAMQRHRCGSAPTCVALVRSTAHSRAKPRVPASLAGCRWSIRRRSVRPSARHSTLRFPERSTSGCRASPSSRRTTASEPYPSSSRFDEARRRGAGGLSFYVVETASDDELRAIATIAQAERPIDAAVLQATAHAYLRGAIAILDHGTAPELRAWAELFGGG
jgi:hypothetical protein